MKEHLAADEYADSAKLREDACAECSEAMSGLNDLVLNEQTADPEQRRAELSVWLGEQCPECQPLDAAVEIAMQIENDEALAGFPDFRVDDLPVTELREELSVYLAEAQAEQRNSVTTGEIAEGVPSKVPLEAGKESQFLTDEATLIADQQALDSEQATLTSDRATETIMDAREKSKTEELAQLQQAFNQLRADGVGTAEALRQVIVRTKNPETQEHLNAILSRVALLQGALPDKPEVVGRLLNASGLNLAAATVAGSFAGFLEAADTDDALTADDRASLRRIIEGGDRQLKTGTQVRNTALATSKDPATGETMPVHTADNKAKVAPGVFTYTETGQNVILEISEGSMHRQVDVTGLDGLSIGTVAEIMGLAALAETNGAGGFIKHVYGVDFDRFADQGVDPLTLASVRQKLTHLINAGHDGEIMQPQHQRQLLEAQMRLVSPDGSLLAWADDPDGYRENVVALGLDHAPVLEAFGTYTQLHAGTGAVNRANIQQHLHSQFADLVPAPDVTATGDMAA